MAIAVQPIFAAATTALPKLPDAINRLKKTAPDVYRNVVEATNRSKVTPEVVAARASRDPVVAQGLVATVLRAGGRASDFIDAGVFPAGSEGQILALAEGYVRRLAANASKDTVEARDPVDFASEIALLRRVCSILSVNEQDLAILLTYFRTHGPEDVQAVVNFKKAAGIRAY